MIWSACSSLNVNSFGVPGYVCRMIEHYVEEKIQILATTREYLNNCRRFGSSNKIFYNAGSGIDMISFKTALLWIFNNNILLKAFFHVVKYLFTIANTTVYIICMFIYKITI